jgi:hypothetical protein
MSIFDRWRTRADEKGGNSPLTAPLAAVGLQEAVIAANLAHPASQTDTRLYDASLYAVQNAAYPRAEPAEAQESPPPVVQPPEPEIDPLRLSEAELDRLCALYGRAILIEICKNPSHFGLSAENDSITDFYRQACATQAEFWEALRIANGDLTEVTDPTAAVWRTAAELTALDWTSRNCRRAINGSV